MTRLAIAAAAFVFASTSAFAGDTYDFKIGGQSVHIEQPRDCNSASCVSVSIPGIYRVRTEAPPQSSRRQRRSGQHRPRQEGQRHPTGADRHRAHSVIAIARRSKRRYRAGRVRQVAGACQRHGDVVAVA